MNTLVTLGCSITRGVGCWGENTRKINSWTRLYDEMKNPKNVKRFLEFGWPNLVGKELGFDKVINLAIDGASNSGQLKHFLNTKIPTENVYVIWMLTESLRFSFYRGGKIVDINPTVETRISKEYLNFVKDSFLDGHKEQLFYINCLREICSNRGYKLILTYWSKSGKDSQDLDSNKSNWLFTNPKELFPTNSAHISSVCTHPNELGYKWIASEIVNGIKENHIHYIVNSPKQIVSYNAIEYSLDETPLFI